LLGIAVSGWSTGLIAGELQVGPAPAWVQEQRHSLESSASSTPSGMEYLFYDEQIRLESHEAFRHYAYKIVSQEGLSDGAQIQFSFDPSYQSITLHSLKVWRDSKAVDYSDAGKFQIIQQEKELDRQIYNGRRTALCFLNDIRVGDVVELSVTKQGENPIYGSHYADEFDVSWGSPVKAQSLRIIPREGQQLFIRWLGQKPPTVQEEQRENGREYWWTVSPMPAEVSEDNAPDWFAQHPYVQISDFKSWAEVEEWALPIYQVPDELGKLFQEKVGQIQAMPGSLEDKAVAAVNFVQKEVRYLGMEMGSGSHLPSPPELVLERRFGDCKDKALLLATLLRKLGVEAYPVLVNSDWNEKIEEQLPSPDVFDHAITLVILDGKSYLIDATASYQAGKHLSDRHMGIYGAGLVVRKGDSGLTRFELGPHDYGGVDIEEHFVIKDYRSPAIFNVTTTFKGGDADSNRSMFSGKSQDEIAKSFRNYYSRSYPGIKTVRPVEMQDDTEHNIVRVREYYEIDKFFEPITKESKKVRAEVDTPYLYDHLPNLNIQGRKSPLALNYPQNLNVTSRIEFPDDWEMKGENTKIETPWFDYQYSEANDGKQVVVRKHSLSMTRQQVPQPDLVDYVAKRKEIIDEAVLRFTNNLSAGETKSTVSDNHGGLFGKVNWVMVMLALVISLISVAIAVWVACIKMPSQPPPLPGDSGYGYPRGLDGWLVLVGIGVCISPINMLRSVVTSASAYWNYDVWMNMTNPASGDYLAWYAVVTPLEMILNCSVVVLSLLLIFLYFAKRRTFKPVYIVFWSTQVLIVAYEFILGKIDSHFGSFDTQSVLTLVKAAAWISYVSVSVRVRNTFVR
jgi:hypothetical protein